MSSILMLKEWSVRAVTAKEWTVGPPDDRHSQL